MKGLKEYIRKHGKHFTEELAHAVTKRRWDTDKIRQHAQRHVYYNVTESTDGDMVYLMDTFHYHLSNQYTWSKALKLMLSWIGDYKKTGSPFCIWLTMTEYHKVDFDFTPYI